MRFVYVARGPERENKQCADILLKLIYGSYLLVYFHLEYCSLIWINNTSKQNSQYNLFKIIDYVLFSLKHFILFDNICLYLELGFGNIFLIFESFLYNNNHMVRSRYLYKNEFLSVCLSFMHGPIVTKFGTEIY